MKKFPTAEPTTSKKRKKKTDTIQETLVLPDKYLLVSADLSMRCPGFSKMLIDKTDGKLNITNIETGSVNNKTSKKNHPEILDDIFSFTSSFFPVHDVTHPIATYFVREKGFNSIGAQSEMTKFKVVGLTDWHLWQRKQEWYEIHPVTVKRLVTGDSKADKIKVAEYLQLYVGEREYATDDESDALAVAIAWLIQNKELSTLEMPSDKEE